MAFQARSSARGADRRRMAVIRAVACVWASLCVIPESSKARARPQTKRSQGSQETNERFRFEVIDSEHDHPIAVSAVSLVYRRRRDAVERKNEIGLRTGKNGIPELPRVTTENLQ